MQYFLRHYKDGSTHFFEFDGERAKREIVFHPKGILLLGSLECTEAPLSAYGFGPQEAINPDNFRRRWQTSLNVPHFTHWRDFQERNGSSVDSWGPTELPEPPPRVKQALRSNPSIIARSFAERLGVNVIDPESLRLAGVFLLERKQEVSRPDWEAILGVTCLLGETLRSSLGGQWLWDEPRQAVLLSGLRTKSGASVGDIDPLLYVMAMWTCQAPADMLNSLYEGYST